MNYETFFQTELESLRETGNYRVFAELERKRGSFPKARKHGDGPDEVTVWCSNDYLGMGQDPDVIATMKEAVDTFGAGSGGTRRRKTRDRGRNRNRRRGLRRGQKPSRSDDASRRQLREETAPRVRNHG
jgi:hypothetical protein